MFPDPQPPALGPRADWGFQVPDVTMGLAVNVVLSGVTAHG